MVIAGSHSKPKNVLFITILASAVMLSLCIYSHLAARKVAFSMGGFIVPLVCTTGGCLSQMLNFTEYHVTIKSCVVVTAFGLYILLDLQYAIRNPYWNLKKTDCMFAVLILYVDAI